MIRNAPHLKPNRSGVKKKILRLHIFPFADNSVKRVLLWRNMRGGIILLSSEFVAGSCVSELPGNRFHAFPARVMSEANCAEFCVAENGRIAYDPAGIGT
jgi:hypothetical protein